MKRILQRSLLVFLALIFTATIVHSQVLEWRLTNTTFTATDPDGGGGPATGVVTFTLQIHTKNGTASNITGMSTGWSWQSTRAMLPTGPAPAPTCGTNSVPQPSNVVMSSTFAGAGFTFNNVNQCSGNVSFTVGGQAFDRRAVGTVDGGTINLTTDWVDVFTVTLWTTGNNSNGGYVVINSGSGSDNSNGPFSTYSVSDGDANEYNVISQTWGTPLLLAAGGPIPVPVEFTRFKADCSNTGTSITWSTATEKNNSHYEVEKSVDGSSWTTLGQISAVGSSSSAKAYRFTDKAGGAAMYRVKQVDIDGAISYTDIVRTSCSSKAFFMNLYPVPARDKLTVVIGSDKSIRTTLQVLDNYGRTVLMVPVVITKGLNNFSLPISQLAQGQYYIKGSADGITVNERFTISR